MDSNERRSRGYLWVIGVIAVLVIAIFVWSKRGSDDRPAARPVAKTGPKKVDTVATKTFKMIEGSIGPQNKYHLLVMETGSDTVKNPDPKKFWTHWTIEDPSFEYEVITPDGSYPCKGEVCRCMPAGPAWTSFRAKNPGITTVPIWFDTLPSTKEHCT